MKPLRTAAEERVGSALVQAFEQSGDSLEARLETFPRYARRKTITRFVTLYELFKRVLDVKGSIVECGVFRGFGLMTWAHLSAVLEPANLTRRIYGFDSFAGFPSVSERDGNPSKPPSAGELRADSFAELSAIVKAYDEDRFLGHIDKVQLIKGDIVQTLPEFLDSHRHLVVSLLFMDLDLYEPTKLTLELLMARMPKGAVLAFDQLDNPIWPGETLAALDVLGIRNLEIRRFPWDPYVGYIVL